ncbi:hypothetical protein KIN20_011805 [Parelaphostrongylus tenuis]|uniref:Uncharacterized protein n=1 Tax=Parelaphostrongylus tenuis TaxID=148309 RepID=A0AAD5MSJ9_PARTN|nr:hypothetical protein KIN20_011805 [Parelaphostrongylus tenuis]
MLFTDEKYLRSNHSTMSETTSTSQELSAEICLAKKNGSGFCDGLARNLRRRKNAVGLRELKRQNQWSQLSAANIRGLLEPRSTQHFGANRFTLQQDWAPTHLIPSTIAVCREGIPGLFGIRTFGHQTCQMSTQLITPWLLLKIENMNRMKSMC